LARHFQLFFNWSKFRVQKQNAKYRNLTSFLTSITKDDETHIFQKNESNNGKRGLARNGPKRGQKWAKKWAKNGPGNWQKRGGALFARVAK
jgi:hypothetical protein